MEKTLVDYVSANLESWEIKKANNSIFKGYGLPYEVEDKIQDAIDEYCLDYDKDYDEVISDLDFEDLFFEATSK